MILQALYDYYHRCGDLPRKGMELKEIGFLIVIDEDGNFIRLENRMIDKKHASQFLVVQTVQRSGRKFVGNCLWDNCDYAIGYSEKNPEKAELCKEAFTERVKQLLNVFPQNIVLRAIYSFYKKYPCVYDIISKDPLWYEMYTSTKNISFIINGSKHIAAEDSDIINFSCSSDDNIEANICLVTGLRGKTARIHAKVPLQGNSFTSLVSFKDGKGYDSYGKSQGTNAPVSEKAEFAYTTAINHLLANNSRNKFILGTRTFLFWSSKNNEAGQKAEESFFALFGFNEQEDDPNKNIEQVRKVFEAIFKGTRKFAETICKHFDDMEVVDTRLEKKPYTSLRNIISTVTLGGKVSDATPNLADAVVKSIFEGLPYPQTLFASCIRRIRAESSEKDKNAVHITRAAIIKAYLNRINNNEQIIQPMLDKENSNQGYLCGRLFAVLDKIQEEANNQNSIRERYMNAASATPATVFATILNLSSHHAENLNEGRKIFFEKIKQEIIDKISANGFPTHLDLQDQGRFFVGYYHQRQDFFTKAEKENNNNN